METCFPIIGYGILAVTILDATGSIASRKLNFNYSWLSGFSFLIYGFIGYYGLLWADMTCALTAAGLVALYDATIGWKISMALKANWGKLEKLVKEDLDGKDLKIGDVITMVIIGIIVGWVGTLFV